MSVLYASHYWNLENNSKSIRKSYVIWIFIQLHLMKVWNCANTILHWSIASTKFWRGKTLMNLPQRTPFTNILPSRIPDSLKWLMLNLPNFLCQNSKTIDSPKFYPVKTLRYYGIQGILVWDNSGINSCVAEQHSTLQKHSYG